MSKQGNKIQQLKSHDDLLIFGYPCKVFRDDQKAAYVEDGRHLIPWMGRPSLMIDRCVSVVRLRIIKLTLYDVMFHSI